MKNIVNRTNRKIKLLFWGAIGASSLFSMRAMAGLGDLDGVAPTGVDVTKPSTMGAGLLTLGVSLVGALIAVTVVAGTAWQIYQAFVEYNTSPKPSLTKLGLTTALGSIIIIATIGLVLFAIKVATP